MKGIKIMNMSPDIFDWLVAMVLVGRGENVQVDVRGKWEDISLNLQYIIFKKNSLYRCKLSVPKQKEVKVESPLVKKNQSPIEPLEELPPRVLGSYGIYE